MKAEVAIELIEKAVGFYIRQNYEVAANLYQLGYDREGYCQGAFEKREEMRIALELAKGMMVER